MQYTRTIGFGAPGDQVYWARVPAAGDSTSPFAASSVGLPAVVMPVGLAVATPPSAICPATVRPVTAVPTEDKDLQPGPRVSTCLLEDFPLPALDLRGLAVIGGLFL